MTEKLDDAEPRSSAPSTFQPAVNPAKPKLVEPGVCSMPRPMPPSTSSVEVPPSVKEGFNYWSHLPYEVEDDDTRLAHLNDIIGDLYMAVRAGDFEAGARTASRQIKRWLHLKFKMPKETRKKLIKLYYELSLTPGIDPSAADTFGNMFKQLASYVSFNDTANSRPRKVPPHELTLDWRPLYDDLYRHFIRPNADPPVNDALGKGKDLHNLTRLARYAQKYFAASEIPAVLDIVLPEVSIPTNVSYD